jgi:hypothetical protein
MFSAKPAESAMASTDCTVNPVQDIEQLPDCLNQTIAMGWCQRDFVELACFKSILNVTDRQTLRQLPGLDHELMNRPFANSAAPRIRNSKTLFVDEKPEGNKSESGGARLHRNYRDRIWCQLCRCYSCSHLVAHFGLYELCMTT